MVIRLGRYYDFTPQVFIAPAGYLIAGGVTGGLYWLLAGIGTPAQRQRKRIATLDADFG
jgi:hypothetical protein